MTREEALDEYGMSDQGEEVINGIFDDIESRTCENCKFYFIHMQYGQGMQCKNHNSEMHQIKIISKDFGCNKFERKIDGI